MAYVVMAYIIMTYMFKYSEDRPKWNHYGEVNNGVISCKCN